MRPGLRIRSIEADGKTRHVFTYKRTVEGQVVEIETEHQRHRLRAAVDAAPRDPAEGRATRGTTATSTGTSTSSRRDDGSTYFAMAEVEMPENDTRRRRCRRRLAAHFLLLRAAQRSALHLQAARRPGSCRAAAGRHPHEGTKSHEDRRASTAIRSRCRSPSAAATTGDGRRTWTTNNILLVRVETDTGLVGWGEAFCYGCTDAVKAALHNMIAPLAIGQDARDIAGLSYDLQQKLHLFGRYGITIFALSGLDIALWDIAGKAANLPLHRLLGGARPRRPAGLCQPAEVSRSRDASRRGPAQAVARRLPPHQAARDRGGRSARGARGGGRRRRDHGRHQLPVDARAGAPHDPEAAALRSASGWRSRSSRPRISRRSPSCAPAPASPWRRARTTARPSSSATCSRPAPSTTPSPASPRWAASRNS